MFHKIFIRIVYLIGGGALMLLCILVAQVNLDDLRLKHGHLRTVTDPVLQVGGFYSIQSDGQIAGPLCVVHENILEKHYINTDAPVMISNVLGSSLPVLVQWGESLMGRFGAKEIKKLTSGSDETSKIQWEGHTLNISSAKNRRLPAISMIPKIIEEIFHEDSECEKTLVGLAKSGQCVAIVVSMTYIANQKIGFKLADELRCMVPDTMNTEIWVPIQPKRFTMYLSVAKDWLGLLDFSAEPPVI